MMIFLYIIAALIAMVVLLTILAPKTYDVSRSIEIERPRSEVFN